MQRRYAIAFIVLVILALVFAACSTSDEVNYSDKIPMANTQETGTDVPTALRTLTQVVITPTPATVEATAAQMATATQVTINLSPSPLETFDCKGVSEIPESECTALIALYQSTNGDAWRNREDWLNTITPCGWEGVMCNDGHVERLFLGNNLLRGSIPSELSQLTNLTTLDLGFNDLSGSIPSELGDLSNLRELFLYHTQLNGKLPLSLKSLDLLVFNFSHTDLCEPSDKTYQSWLSNIESGSSTDVTCEY